jgi:hypothetical protein
MVRTEEDKVEKKLMKDRQEWEKGLQERQMEGGRG